MAIVYYGANSVGADIRILAAWGTDYFIDEGVTIGSTNNTAIYGTNTTFESFTILGTVFGFDRGIYLTAPQDSPYQFVDINIGATGRILSETNAIELRGETTLLPGTINIINHGWIKGVDHGIYNLGALLFYLENTGTIEITGDAENTATIFSDAQIPTIRNSGAIVAKGNATAIALTRDFDSAGVNEITNTGEIWGGFHFAISTESYWDDLNNEGLIYGAINLAAGDDPTNDVSDMLFNTGTIISTLHQYAINMGHDSDTLENHGVISGEIIMEHGDDIVINTGTINGKVRLGSEDDTFLGETGIVNGEVLGEAGDDIIKTGDGADIIRGGSGDDELHGGGGNDEIHGGTDDDILIARDGDDLLFGGNGRDKLYGGTGNDTVSYEFALDPVRVSLASNRGRGGEAAGDWLFDIENLIGSDLDDSLTGNELTNVLEGRNGDDRLDGNGGNDFLLGENGDDTLVGGDGDDILNGGLGRDILWSGTGADIFEFLDVAESGTGSDRDVIKDFEQGLDLIDLSAMGATSFSDSGFTNTAGEVTFRLLSSDTKTLIEYDHDGDGVADFHILMTNGGLTMTADDFVLG